MAILMSYRIVNIANFYPDYLDFQYKRKPELKGLSYADHIDTILSDGFGGMGALRTNMRKLGVDAYGIVANASLLQNAWANERGIKGNEMNILREQLKHLRPDVVIFDSCAEHNGEFVAQIKDEVPSVKLVIGSRSAPYTIDLLEKFKAFDFMITCSEGIQAEFQKYGLRTYLINQAFDHNILPAIQDDNKYPEADCIFFGSIVAGEGFHNYRREILERLLEMDMGLLVHCSLPESSSTRLLAKQSIYSVCQLFKLLGIDRLASRIPYFADALRWQSFPAKPYVPGCLKNGSLPPLFGVEMLKALSKAKIGLNIHIDVAGNYAANIRLFEVTGVGSCLLTDYKENIADIFVPGTEIVTYDSVEDCAEKMAWLLNHPKERKEIAKAGQKRTLTCYTFERRARELNEIIKKEMS